MSTVSLEIRSMETARGGISETKTGFLVNTYALAMKLAARGAFIAPLLTRVVVGWLFLNTGWGKWQNFEDTVGFFTELGIPGPRLNAAFVATLELAGGAMLILGLGSRLFAAGLLSTMAVAVLTAHRDEFVSALKDYDASALTDISPVVLGLFLTWPIFHGPGAISVDHFIRKWFINTPASGSHTKAEVQNA